MAQLGRRWALERTSLWDTLGPLSGLKDAQADERGVFGPPAFVVSPELIWRLAAEQLRELERLGQRSYPRLVPYQEWLPGRTGRDTSQVCQMWQP